jgi:hypothetical protein
MVSRTDIVGLRGFMIRSYSQIPAFKKEIESLSGSRRNSFRQAVHEVFSIYQRSYGYAVYKHDKIVFRASNKTECKKFILRSYFGMNTIPQEFPQGFVAVHTAKGFSLYANGKYIMNSKDIESLYVHAYFKIMFGHDV